ncbi:MAG: hypothetical protein ABGY72_04620, partial [bacterium]
LWTRWHGHRKPERVQMGGRLARRAGDHPGSSYRDETTHGDEKCLFGRGRSRRRGRPGKKRGQKVGELPPTFTPAAPMGNAG